MSFPDSGPQASLAAAMDPGVYVDHDAAYGYDYSPVDSLPDYGHTEISYDSSDPYGANHLHIQDTYASPNAAPSRYAAPSPYLSSRHNSYDDDGIWRESDEWMYDEDDWGYYDTYDDPDPLESVWIPSLSPATGPADLRSVPGAAAGPVYARLGLLGPPMPHPSALRRTYCLLHPAECLQGLAPRSAPTTQLNLAFNADGTVRTVHDVQAGDGDGRMGGGSGFGPGLSSGQEQGPKIDWQKVDLSGFGLVVLLGLVLFVCLHMGWSSVSGPKTGLPSPSQPRRPKEPVPEVIQRANDKVEQAAAAVDDAKTDAEAATDKVADANRNRDRAKAHVDETKNDLKRLNRDGAPPAVVDDKKDKLRSAEKEETSARQELKDAQKEQEKAEKQLKDAERAKREAERNKQKEEEAERARKDEDRKRRAAEEKDKDKDKPKPRLGNGDGPESRPSKPSSDTKAPKGLSAPAETEKPSKPKEESGRPPADPKKPRGGGNDRPGAPADPKKPRREESKPTAPDIPTDPKKPKSEGDASKPAAPTAPAGPSKPRDKGGDPKPAAPAPPSDTKKPKDRGGEPKPAAPSAPDEKPRPSRAPSKKPDPVPEISKPKPKGDEAKAPKGDKPAKPAEQTDPAKPANSDKPGRPKKPTDTREPKQPDARAKPEEAGKPMKPDEVARPEKAEQPVKPNTPEEPKKPASLTKAEQKFKTATSERRDAEEKLADVKKKEDKSKQSAQVEAARRGGVVAETPELKARRKERVKAENEVESKRKKEDAAWKALEAEEIKAGLEPTKKPSRRSKEPDEAPKRPSKDKDPEKGVPPVTLSDKEDKRLRNEAKKADDEIANVLPKLDKKNAELAEVLTKAQRAALKAAEKEKGGKLTKEEEKAALEAAAAAPDVQRQTRKRDQEADKLDKAIRDKDRAESQLAEGGRLSPSEAKTRRKAAEKALEDADKAYKKAKAAGVADTELEALQKTREYAKQRLGEAKLVDRDAGVRAGKDDGKQSALTTAMGEVSRLATPGVVICALIAIPLLTNVMRGGVMGGPWTTTPSAMRAFNPPITLPATGPLVVEERWTATPRPPPVPPPVLPHIPPQSSQAQIQINQVSGTSGPSLAEQQVMGAGAGPSPPVVLSGEPQVVPQSVVELTTTHSPFVSAMLSLLVISMPLAVDKFRGWPSRKVSRPNVFTKTTQVMVLGAALLLAVLSNAQHMGLQQYPYGDTFIGAEAMVDGLAARAGAMRAGLAGGVGVSELGAFAAVLAVGLYIGLREAPSSKKSGDGEGWGFSPWQMAATGAAAALGLLFVAS